jgi:hypothetical protein
MTHPSIGELNPPLSSTNGHGPGRKRSRRWILTALIVVVAGAVAIALTHPFSATAARSGALTDNAYPTSNATVIRENLSSQTSVNATLGYGGAFSVVNQSTGTITSLPEVGQVISQGHVLYTVNGRPVVLLYGSTPSYRSLAQGASGSDVRELNADLVSMGDATRSELSPASHSFTDATAAAVMRLQSSLAESVTGTVRVGEAVFLPTAVRITSDAATLGGPARSGQTIISATSTARVVTVALNADQQSEVKVGDPVTITLPDTRRTPGVVSQVGTVATNSTASGNPLQDASGTPSVTVLVTPSDPAATGSLDQSPVTVAITTATVHDGLVVPVDALLALSGGGYAVEVVATDGSHHLVAVTLGLFDDADGAVHVSGPGLAAGQTVVVPGG